MSHEGCGGTILTGGTGENRCDYCDHCDWVEYYADRYAVKVNHGAYTVEDAEGGTWHPNPATAAEIAASGNPEETAMRICADEPWRGTWHC